MPDNEIVTVNLRGMYRDVLRDARGRVTWDSGWQKNAIVTDCRRLLAGFMLGQANTLGIQGLQVGAGLDAWDSLPGGKLPPNTAQTLLVDPFPYTVDRSDVDPIGPVFTLQYLPVPDMPDPTNKLQIAVRLGPGVPPWPEPGPNPDHPTSTLREFGLIGQLDGATVLINYITHPAIAKDAASTLERTIWLVF